MGQGKNANKIPTYKHTKETMKVWTLMQNTRLRRQYCQVNYGMRAFHTQKRGKPTMRNTQNSRSLCKTEIVGLAIKSVSNTCKNTNEQPHALQKYI